MKLGRGASGISGGLAGVTGQQGPEGARAGRPQEWRSRQREQPVRRPWGTHTPGVCEDQPEGPVGPGAEKILPTGRRAGTAVISSYGRGN